MLYTNVSIQSQRINKPSDKDSKNVVLDFSNTYFYRCIFLFITPSHTIVNLRSKLAENSGSSDTLSCSIFPINSLLSSFLIYMFFTHNLLIISSLSIRGNLADLLQ